MRKELIELVKKRGFSIFGKEEPDEFQNEERQILKTKDARAVSTRALNLLKKRFVFDRTSKILSYFGFPKSAEEIKNRQEYFKSLRKSERVFLGKIKTPRPFWNPDYGVIVATEDDTTFRELKDMGCGVKFIVNESDVMELERYDVVQFIDCENFSRAIERLPQSIQLNSIDEAYLERHVRELSGWKENLEIMRGEEINEEIEKNVNELYSLVYLTDSRKKEKLTREKVEDALEEIREEISAKVKEISLSGDSLLLALNKGALPKELNDIVRDAIKKTNMPESLFVKGIPVSIDEKELENFLRNQSLNEFANTAHEIKMRAKELIKIPEKFKELERQLILFDFESAIANWNDGKKFAEIGVEIILEDGKNEFLDRAVPISFHLNAGARCSILTGANSGGKTTLLEHVIQAIIYSYVGLPIDGDFRIPLLEEIYYFAKNKGSASKGAFETLLTQLSQVKGGGKTLILADEIEAVTEPGVAGKIISASAQFFIDKGCYLIFATHLGQEIQKMLPVGARIDGIEAKGLDENNELIVDHNPVLGRLASSTPELIVEKMAKTTDKEYFRFLFEFLRMR